MERQLSREVHGCWAGMGSHWRAVGEVCTKQDYVDVDHGKGLGTLC